MLKFNLAFAPGTDVELLRKTVKKIGVDMMAEPQFKPIIMQPLKMQGVVDIKDSQVIVRFKVMTRPKNPSLVQRTAIRRMYDTLPGLGIRFAVPVFPGMMGVRARRRRRRHRRRKPRRHRRLRRPPSNRREFHGRETCRNASWASPTSSSP